MRSLNFIKNRISIFIRPFGKRAFLHKFNGKISILDVGCGNESVNVVKSLLPESYYVGLDVHDYNLSEKSKKHIDQYIITTPDKFHDEILKNKNKFDLVLSNHNLEHCNHREQTLDAMISSIKDDGFIHLSFPSEKSTTFPSRRGTLNYFDDKTHKYGPPNYDVILDELNKNNFEIIYSTKHYRPRMLYILGMIIEPISKITKRVYKGTWEFFGFESIIIAKKKSPINIE